MDAFESGPRLDGPVGDPARQAVASLRGYGYQVYASALAWLGLGDGEILHLEVAEDFSVSDPEAIVGTQVKDTVGSCRITLRSTGVLQAVDTFVDLVHRNPGRKVSLHYLTTSGIGLERSVGDRIQGGPALAYWRRAAAGADVSPLRDAISSLDLAPATKAHVAALSDARLRTELLARIHWHCGAPGLPDLREDLCAGLIEYVGTNRRLSSHVGRGLVPIVVERVLLTATSKGDRRLRRADLLTLIDESSRISVPVDRVAEAFGGASRPAGFVRPSLLLSAAELPLPEPLAPRTTLVREIDRLRAASGAVFVTGATGLGKSLAARLAADGTGAPWSIVDFRDLNAADVAARLLPLLGELAVAPSTNLILDDLDGLEDPRVRDLLARVLRSLRRRDASAIVTAYAGPASTTLHALAPGGVPVIGVPYLDEDEVADLVVRAGGEAKYAAYVYRAAARGHPQLSAGIVLRLSQSGWDRSTLASLLGGEPDPEMGGERRAARRRLMTAMPAEATTLLLRASLVEGGFDRKMALALGGLSPAIPLAGLVLDRLVGPWIEPSRRDRLRVSPLLEGAGGDVLSEAECRAVHVCVADGLLRRGSLSVLDADTLLRHALRSGDPVLAAAFANSVITCDEETLETLAPFAGALRRLDCTRPIIPRHPPTSAMLRLAQLLVLLPDGSPASVRRCWDALERERIQVRGRESFECTVLAKALMHPRAGDVLPDWLGLLLRLDLLVRSDEGLAAASSDHAATSGGPPDLVGTLLSSQTRGLRTVASFRSLVERLDREPPDVRARCLSAFRPGRCDPSILVNHGWMREASDAAFDWSAAADDYAACAELTISWGDAILAVRCKIAEAICVDEFGDDPERALACLGEAERRYGFDVALGRARAKVHWRRRDHAVALPLLTAAAEAGGQDPLERLFIAREAGISAAELGDWSMAGTWFARAHAAAETIPHASVKAMAIGLRADMGHAACRAGEPLRALRDFRAAVALLATIDPDGPLPEAYCHRIVCNGVLWFFRTISGTADPDDREVAYVPGCGSNMEPREEIRSLPVGSIDYARYLLASADLGLPEPSGYHREFRGDLTGGPILAMEILLTALRARRVIAHHESEDFVESIRHHAATASMIRSGEAVDPPGSVSSPRRGTVAPASIDGAADEGLRRAAEDFALTFAIVAAVAGDFGAVDAAVAAGLDAPELVAIHPLLERMCGRATGFARDVDGAAITIHAMRTDPRRRPVDFLWCGIWLVLHLRTTALGDSLVDPVVTWLFEGWRDLARDGRFLLVAPSATVPPIDRILDRRDGRTAAGAAALLLAAVPAAGTRIRSDLRGLLVEMAAALPE